MKTQQEIKEALQQGYKNLGLGETAFDGVAALGNNIETDEQLAAFVQGAEIILKAFQSEGDRVRTSLRTPKPEPKDNPPPTQGVTLEQIQSLLQQQQESSNIVIQALKDEIVGLKNSRTLEVGLTDLKSKMFSSEGSKHYTEYMNNAWDDAIEIFNEGGQKKSMEELEALVNVKFNTYCSRNGITDPMKPIDGDDGSKNTKTAISSFLEKKGETKDTETLSTAFGLDD